MASQLELFLSTNSYTNSLSSVRAINDESRYVQT